MSCCTPEKTWHLGSYRYPFYRYTVEESAFKHHPKTLLDAGCGPEGSSLSCFSNYFFVGVDICRANVKASKKKYPKKEYILASLTCLPFKKGSFEEIVCVDVIEHIDDKSAVFNELSRVVQVNGHFVGSTSNMMNPLLFFDSFLPNFSAPLQNKFSPGHYERHKRVSPKSLFKGLFDAGFRSEYRIFGFPLFNPWFYQYGNVTVPFYGLVWICMDRLFSFRLFVFLKETLVWMAEKQSDGVQESKI